MAKAKVKTEAPLIHSDDVEFHTEAYYNLGLIRRELIKYVTRIEGNEDAFDALAETFMIIERFAVDRTNKERDEMKVHEEAAAARAIVEAEALAAAELADAEQALASTEAELSMLGTLVARLKGE